MTFQSHNPATGELIEPIRSTIRRKQTSAFNALGRGGGTGRARLCMSARPFSCAPPICWTGGRKPMAA